MRIHKSQSKGFNGYSGPRSTNISRGESVDVKESVSNEQRINTHMTDAM